jgi:hypothetical protein
MEGLMTRLVALGAALVITIGVLAVAGLASRYISDRTRPAPKPPQAPQEYIINLTTPSTKKGP